MKIIVYPDADEGDDELLAGYRRDSLEKFGEFKVFSGPPNDNVEFLERTQDANALIIGWSLPVEVMREIKHLEVISFTGIGAGTYIDLPAASEQGATVCNCPGYADNTVAEHTLALLFAATRHLPKLHADIRHGKWNQALPGTELRGKNLGLIGFGGIAQRVCELANALGMQVKAWTRNPNDERAAKHGIEFVELDDLLRTSDVLSLHIALSEKTENLLGAKEFALMKDGVFLVNTARGELIDDEVLINALQSGKIQTAALDVFRKEPLPPNHPFTKLDNVILSPHVAYNTPEAREVLYDITVNNIVQFYKGVPINVVT
ncbi:MAG: hypothetical protein OER96_00510 [Gammaproteobacteria bacterium]|nr:hypothetical protein [Gammaproteobacteria bacterium]